MTEHFDPLPLDPRSYESEGDIFPYEAPIEGEIIIPSDEPLVSLQDEVLTRADEEHSPNFVKARQMIEDALENHGGYAAPKVLFDTGEYIPLDEFIGGNQLFRMVSFGEYKLLVDQYGEKIGTNTPEAVIKSLGNTAVKPPTQAIAPAQAQPRSYDHQERAAGEHLDDRE